MTLDEIRTMPIAAHVAEKSHLYLWCPNALLEEGLSVMKAWGYAYKTNIVWYKIRKDGGPDGRGVGFYFRNVTELLLFGTRGKLRTLSLAARKSTCSIRVNKSILESPWKRTTLSRRAALRRFSSCSRANAAQAGRNGAMSSIRTCKPARSTSHITATRAMARDASLIAA